MSCHNDFCPSSIPTSSAIWVVGGCWSPSQLCLVEGRVAPWTSHQIITLPHRKRNIHSLSNSHLRTNLEFRFTPHARFWTVGENRRKPMQDTGRPCKLHARPEDWTFLRIQPSTFFLIIPSFRGSCCILSWINFPKAKLSPLHFVNFVLYV